MQYLCGTPESAGIPSAALLRTLQELKRFQYIHSFLVIRHDIEVAAAWWKPYNEYTPHRLYSLSKSFISCAVGIAIQEGYLSLSDKLTEIFPEYRPVIRDPRFEKMTIRHLLTMSSGHGQCATAFFRQEPDADFIHDFFTSPLVFEPGSKFVYNSAATFMLSASVRRRTGENPVDYLHDRMLAPLGIGHRPWDKTPDGTDFGGWGYHLTTREIASFAQMLLHRGKSGGRQLIPEKYLDLATTYQISNADNLSPDWKQGYGFQFWRCRHNCFRGDGAFGQYALVMPDHDMTVSITSGGKNMQQILDILWEHLLPHLADHPLPEDPETAAELQAQINALALPQLHGKAPEKTKIITAEMQENPVGIHRVRLELFPSVCKAVFETQKGCRIIRAGWGNAIEDLALLNGKESRPTPCSATAEQQGNDLRIKAWFYETPFCTDFTFTEKEGVLTVREEQNLYFLTDPAPEICGRILKDKND